LRYGMSGNEAEAANPLCQVTRVVQQSIANRQRELEAQPPNAATPLLVPSGPTHVCRKPLESISLVHTETPSRYHPYIPLFGIFLLFVTLKLACRLDHANNAFASWWRDGEDASAIA